MRILPQTYIDDLRLRMHRLVILLVIPQRQNEPSIKPMLPVSAESFSRKFQQKEQRRAGDSNPQPLAGHLISNQAASQFAYPPAIARCRTILFVLLPMYFRPECRAILLQSLQAIPAVAGRPHDRAKCCERAPLVLAVKLIPNRTVLCILLRMTQWPK
jgi:hypothetical protein